MGMMETEFRTNVLIQPEVLSTKMIVDILRQRGAKIKDDEERPKLLDLYDKLVLPKPQRSLSEERRSHKALIHRREEFSKKVNNGISVSAAGSAKDSPSPSENINRKRPANNSDAGRETEESPGSKKRMISWP